jgi:hypothetical protein
LASRSFATAFPEEPDADEGNDKPESGDRTRTYPVCVASRRHFRFGQADSLRKCSSPASARNTESNLVRDVALSGHIDRGGNDPLLYLERRAYLEALAAACSGLESARVVLAKARQRIEREVKG